MDEAIFVNCLNSKDDLSYVESSDILREDLILDQHCHQITSRQKLHQHVKEVVILESGVELYNPRTVRFRKDISLCTNVCQLILLEHFTLDERLHSVDLAILLLLYKLHFSKSTLSDDLQSLVVVWRILGSQESQIFAFLLTSIGPGLLSS